MPCLTQVQQHGETTKKIVFWVCLCICVLNHQCFLHAISSVLFFSFTASEFSKVCLS